jgi:UPF0716 family protein affecting phage T7 exclusion
LYGNVRNKFPIFDVTHSIGIALILGIFFITVLLIVFSSLLGLYILRRIKRKKEKINESQNP